MSTEIATQAGGAVAKPDRPDWLSELAKSKEWLCRIDQAAQNSTLVMEGKRQGGNFYYVVKKDNEIDLGRSFEAMVIAVRPKALDLRDKANPVGYYDMQSKEFQNLIELSKVKESGGLAGPEFLLWIPKIKKFASYMYANASAKNVAEITTDLRGQWVTYAHKLARNKAQQTWHTFTVAPCTVPQEAPPKDAFDAVLLDFKNPKSGPEVDESAAAKDDR